jgi:hypothetical protein
MFNLTMKGKARMSLVFEVKSKSGLLSNLQNGVAQSKVIMFGNQNDEDDPAEASGGFAVLFWGQLQNVNNIVIEAEPVDRYGIPYNGKKITVANIAGTFSSDLVRGTDEGRYYDFTIPKAWGVKISVTVDQDNKTFDFDLIY